MRLFLIDRIESGARLGKTIYGEDGRVLLSRGTELTPSYVETLQQMGYQALYVLDPLTMDVPFHEPVTERTRQQAIASVRDTFRRFREDDRSVDQDWTGRRMLYNAVTGLISELQSNRNLNLQLAELRSLSTYTFQHSVNVCILGVAIAQSLGYPYGKLADLALGLMVHDVGKTALPLEHANQHEGIERIESQAYRQHPRLGFDILQQMARSLPSPARIVTLQHHERFDGSGFPKGLAGSEIHPFAQLATLANTYDNLIHDMYHGRPVPAYQAIEYLMASGGSHFDHALVVEFLKLLVPFPLETTVRLSTGEEGLVVEIRRDLPSRPRVLVLTDPDGKRRLKPIDLDLAQHPDVTIVQAL